MSRWPPSNSNFRPAQEARVRADEGGRVRSPPRDADLPEGFERMIRAYRLESDGVSPVSLSGTLPPEPGRSCQGSLGTATMAAPPLNFIPHPRSSLFSTSIKLYPAHESAPKSRTTGRCATRKERSAEPPKAVRFDTSVPLQGQALGIEEEPSWREQRPLGVGDLARSGEALKLVDGLTDVARTLCPPLR